MSVPFMQGEKTCNVTYGSSVNCTIGSPNLVNCTMSNCTIGILSSNRRRYSMLFGSESHNTGGIWFCMCILLRKCCVLSIIIPFAREKFSCTCCISTTSTGSSPCTSELKRPDRIAANCEAGSKHCMHARKKCNMHNIKWMHTQLSQRTLAVPGRPEVTRVGQHWLALAEQFEPSPGGGF